MTEHGQNKTVRRPKLKSYATAFIAGILGAAAMSCVMAVLRGLDITEINFEMTLGAILHSSRDGNTWMIGFAWHLLNGGIFGLAYALIFRVLRHASAITGELVALVHWGVSSYFISFLANVNFFGWKYSGDSQFVIGNNQRFEIVTLLLLHIMYGAIVGGICLYFWRRSTADLETRSRLDDRSKVRTPLLS